jgi:hypothetical protein
MGSGVRGERFGDVVDIVRQMHFLHDEARYTHWLEPLRDV